MHMTLFLDGIPPSKKNEHRRCTSPTGRRFIACSARYGKWEADAMLILRSQWRAIRHPMPAKPAAINITFQASDLRPWDLSNKAESIMDALVGSGILPDDNRFHVRPLVLDCVQKKPTGALITIAWNP